MSEGSPERNRRNFKDGCAGEQTHKRPPHLPSKNALVAKPLPRSQAWSLQLPCRRHLFKQRAISHRQRRERTHWLCRAAVSSAKGLGQTTAAFLWPHWWTSTPLHPSSYRRSLDSPRDARPVRHIATHMSRWQFARMGHVCGLCPCEYCAWCCTTPSCNAMQPTCDADQHAQRCLEVQLVRPSQC